MTDAFFSPVSWVSTWQPGDPPTRGSGIGLWRGITWVLGVGGGVLEGWVLRGPGIGEIPIFGSGLRETGRGSEGRRTL